MLTTAETLKTTLQLFPLPAPGVNPFDMSEGALARLHAGEENTIAAFKAEKERIRRRLVRQLKVFTLRSVGRADLALDIWHAWVWAGGSFSHAAMLLRDRFGHVLTCEAIHHRISSLMKAGNIPRHRLKKPSSDRVGVSMESIPLQHVETDRLSIVSGADSVR